MKGIDGGREAVHIIRYRLSVYAKPESHSKWEAQVREKLRESEPSHVEGFVFVASGEKKPRCSNAPGFCLFRHHQGASTTPQTARDAMPSVVATLFIHEPAVAAPEWFDGAGFLSRKLPVLAQRTAQSQRRMPQVRWGCLHERTPWP